MFLSEGNIQSLSGGLRLKVRVQHPGIHERTDRGGSYWFFRYWDDVRQPGGKTKPVRKFHVIGASKGENRLSKKQAEVERDKFNPAGLPVSGVESARKMLNPKLPPRQF